MKTKIALLCFTFFVFSCGEKDADNNNRATNYDHTIVLSGGR